MAVGSFGAAADPMRQAVQPANKPARRFSVAAQARPPEPRQNGAAVSRETASGTETAVARAYATLRRSTATLAQP